MTVYAAKEVRKVYSYGENGKIHGYIAPVAMIKDHNAIRKMIGWKGSVVIVDSEGRIV